VIRRVGMKRRRGWPPLSVRDIERLRRRGSVDTRGFLLEEALPDAYCEAVWIALAAVERVARVVLGMTLTAPGGLFGRASSIEHLSYVGAILALATREVAPSGAQALERLRAELRGVVGLATGGAGVFICVVVSKAGPISVVRKGEAGA